MGTIDNITIYTDGACAGNPGPGGWAAIIAWPDRLEELGGHDPDTTNNRMEMSAAIEALKHIPADAHAIIFTDSQYLKNGITSWIAGWKRRGWQKADGQPVLNKDLWVELDSLSANRVQWNYVKGHADNPYNNRCDEIAVGFSKCKPVSLKVYARQSADEQPVVKQAPSAMVGGVVWDWQTNTSMYLSLIDGMLERHATWARCYARVNGVRGARFRKANNPDDERTILKSWKLL